MRRLLLFVLGVVLFSSVIVFAQNPPPPKITIINDIVNTLPVDYGSDGGLFNLFVEPNNDLDLSKNFLADLFFY